jgi:hypothetical protein
MTKPFLGAVLALALFPAAIPAAPAATAATKTKPTPHFTHKRSLDLFHDKPARTLASGSGLVGIGPYVPPGYLDTGVKAPPLTLYPRAGAGVSLNIDPITGQPYR